MFQDGERIGNIQLQMDKLSPFLSVVLIRNANTLQVEEHEQYLRTWVHENFINLYPEKRIVIRSIYTQQQNLRDRPILYTVLYYTERKESSWTKQVEVRDYVNQVVIMTSWNNFSALYFSDNELKGNFVNYLFAQDSQSLLPKPIEKNRMNAIFVNGPARTLWLAGIHQRKSIRADSKTLMGANIRDVLNPLDDQSFYFTSARCYQKDWDKTTGVSPSKSQIWIRKTQSWDDFCGLVNEVLIRLYDNYDHVDENPFSILATPLTNLDSVQNAFDVNFLYPETSAEDARDEDQDNIRLLEDLSYHTSFSVTGDRDTPNFQAQMIYKGNLLGSINVDFHNQAENKKNWVFNFLSAGGNHNLCPFINKIPRLIRGGKYLQIRYESGHTFSGGEFFQQRFRDLGFTGWKYEDFSQYEVNKEKPSSNDQIGTDGSLFCWVWNEYSANSWLYCDDSSGEVADFVKLESNDNLLKISLIHVKATSGDENRRFSVSAYEIVTAQAVKNLRHFQIDNLINQVSREDENHFLYRIKRNGSTPQDSREAGQFRNEFIATLRTTSANIQREVIVLQPHNRRRSIENITLNSNARCQLNTLLLSVETTCKSLGANFYVITDQS